MFHLLARNWWLQLVRGILALTFGVVFLALRDPDLTVLVVLVATFAVADGLMSTIIGASSRSVHRGWPAFLGLGLLQVALGLIVLFRPDQSEAALVYLFAAWSLATGALTLVGAFSVRRVRGREWALTAIGAFTIAFGAYLFVAPSLDAFDPGTAFGIFAMVIGAMLLAVSLRLRRLLEKPGADDVERSVVNDTANLVATAR